ncbi:MAG: TIGR00303 family protein [Pegethrix bostrychoides GSE-TBD4-15B]|jgi:uncharacterized protein (TIGR00303 family)|uniref:UPF0284 protein KME07_01610 n=1 Tax=Pegethrix bostrychoides GSE-TBD4-15B TaxID=2839662 RepID=A0A951P6Z9_9CYAN|nr:TIGR00303 family protein [Pegethrix bostrychoides GSE-TBD4-15B]
MIQLYSPPDSAQFRLAQGWLARFDGLLPLFACVLGFTETGLIPGISAAGATPDDRRYTALADAEFLGRGVSAQPTYPLPPLQAGASPVLITRAVLSAQQIPLALFNAGLPISPSVSAIDLGGSPARCLSRANALDLATAQHLFAQGWIWGEKLAAAHPYLVLSECVVGGTTTALALLMGLGWAADGKVNSSHPVCNHQQKRDLVQAGLAKLPTAQLHPLALWAAIGDPMQGVVAGMALAASRHGGVLLAGGTQMLAVYALMRTIAQADCLDWQPEQVLVGTTRWVAEDVTGDTVGLANLLQAPLIATQLSFADSRHPALQAYEQGYVKEGVGAGGSAIAAHLYQHWEQADLLRAIDQLADELFQNQSAEPLQRSGKS